MARATDQDHQLARTATQAWLWLLIFGGAIALFTFIGLVIGWRELTAGILHLFEICRTLLRLPPHASPAVSLIVSGIAVLSALLAAVSCAHEIARTYALGHSLSRRALPPDDRVAVLARNAGLPRPVVVVADEARYAMTVGLLRPRVFLSAALATLLEPDELEAVLRHEGHHVRQRDPLRLLIGRATRRALFFVPVVPDLWERYLAAAELAADGAAVEVQGRAPLARALLKLFSVEARPAPLVPGLNSLADLRIAYLLEPGDGAALPPVRGVRVLASALILLLAFGLVPLQTPPSFLDVFAHAGLTCTL